jgi:hypothetical protein
MERGHYCEGGDAVSFKLILLCSLKDAATADMMLGDAVPTISSYILHFLGEKSLPDY